MMRHKILSSAATSVSTPSRYGTPWILFILITRPQSLTRDWDEKPWVRVCGQYVFRRQFQILCLMTGDWEGFKLKIWGAQLSGGMSSCWVPHNFQQDMAGLRWSLGNGFMHVYPFRSPADWLRGHLSPRVDNSSVGINPFKFRHSGPGRVSQAWDDDWRDNCWCLTGGIGYLLPRVKHHMMMNIDWSHWHRSIQSTVVILILLLPDFPICVTLYNTVLCFYFYFVPVWYWLKKFIDKNKEKLRRGFCQWTSTGKITYFLRWVSITDT